MLLTGSVYSISTDNLSYPIIHICICPVNSKDYMNITTPCSGTYLIEEDDVNISAHVAHILSTRGQKAHTYCSWVRNWDR